MDDMDEFLNQVNSGSRRGNPRPEQPAQANDQQSWTKTVMSASCWAKTGAAYFPVSEVVDILPAGAFLCRATDNGPYFEKMSISIDNLLTLPDSATEILLEEFSQFWGLKDKFDKRGYTFKRGMLMWGPPGSGKTSAIWQMTQRLIRDHNGIVVFVDNPQLAVWCLSVFRRIEQTRKVVVVYEDLDAIVHQHGEHQLLGLLDGEFQLSNVVHLATTNYPDRLDRRFIDRPSRFDTIMKVGMPTAAARLVYFKAKEPELDNETLERWVSRTNGYSVAHLREVSIAIQCFGQPEEKVFNRLDKMRELIVLNDDGDDERAQVGFVRPKRFVR